jgi:transcriptional regulator with XRE-family HTH domain
MIQIRAARGLLGWTLQELAAKVGVHWNSLANIEAERFVGHPRTLAAIRKVLEGAGVEFTNGKRPGVRLRA